MATQVRNSGSWKTLGPTKLLVKNGGSWKPTNGFVRDAGTWKQFHVKSDPDTQTFSLGTTGWSQVYRGTSGVTSNRTNGDDLCYWGFSWNTEIERSMISFDDIAAIKTMLDTRPNVTSMKLYVWVGHVYSGTQEVRVATHDQATKPSTFTRNHAEITTGWTLDFGAVKPGGAGALHTITLDATTRQNWGDGIRDENIEGLTFSNESATDPNNIWGWLSGTQHSTGNSGGSASGLNDLIDTDSQRLRLEITSDYEGT